MDEPIKKRVEEHTVISIRHMGAYKDIGAVYRRLRNWAKQKGVKVTGNGCTIFHEKPTEFDAASSVFEVCLPVEGTPQAEGEVEVKTLPGGTMACTIVTGPYSEIPAHYAEMVAWLDYEGWEVAGPPREVYIKTPSTSGKSNEQDLVTEIQFPVKD